MSAEVKWWQTHRNQLCLDKTETSGDDKDNAGDEI